MVNDVMKMIWRRCDDVIDANDSDHASPQDNSKQVMQVSIF